VSLASLLWRIRRATAIETTLLGIQGEIARARRRSRDHNLISGFWGRRAFDHCHEGDPNVDNVSKNPESSGPTDPLPESARVLSLCFQRLVNFDGDVFERLGRYETVLARQIVQVIFLLRSARRR